MHHAVVVEKVHVILQACKDFADCGLHCENNRHAVCTSTVLSKYLLQ